MFRRYIKIALLGSAITALLGGGAVTTRLLPWLVSPTVPRAVAWIFAKSLTTATLEVAVAFGWITGWALLSAADVASGEARVHELLGRSPRQTTLHRFRQALPLTALLFTFSFFAGRDASAPGAIVNGLMQEARDACASDEGTNDPRSIVEVPFANASWLCAKGETPLLYMTVRALPITARDARVSSDLSRATLRDVRTLVGPAAVHAQHVEIRGLRPWTLPSPLSPFVRASSISLGAALASLVIAHLFFKLRVRSRGVALVVGLGSSASLFLALRSLERAPVSQEHLEIASAALLIALPAALASLLLLVTRFLSRRLPRPPATATF